MKLRDKITNTIDHDYDDAYLLSLFYDGIDEITQRVLALDPSKAETFLLTQSTEIPADESLIKGFSRHSSHNTVPDIAIYGDIVSVKLEISNTDSSVYENKLEEGYYSDGTKTFECQKVSINDIQDVQNSTSLKYKGIGNPAYCVIESSFTGHSSDDGLAGPRGNQIVIAPDPSLYSGAKVIVSQIMYNVPEYWRTYTGSTGSGLIINPLDSPVFRVKFESANPDAAGASFILFEFSPRYQTVLFNYVVVQILTALIIKAGVLDEDEELVKTLKETKEEYKTKYDEFFTYMGAGNQKGEAQDES